MGFGRFGPNARVVCGLYRADLLHGSDDSAEASRHVKQWISWINPRTPTPDFDVPSSLDWLEIRK
jgi:hypothetical protein